MMARNAVGGTGRIAAVLMLGLAPGWGCSSSTLEPPSEAARNSVPGPKGSFALALPERLGYVELLVERIGGSGKPPTPSLVLAAYFIGPDGQGPMTDLPTAVEAFLEPLGGPPAHVALVPRPLGKDEWARARFASEPGDFSQDEFRGELKVVAGGKTVSVPIAFR